MKELLESKWLLAGMAATIGVLWFQHRQKNVEIMNITSTYWGTVDDASNRLKALLQVTDYSQQDIDREIRTFIAEATYALDHRDDRTERRRGIILPE